MARQDSPITNANSDDSRSGAFLQFNAEVKEVKAKKMASLDVSYRIILETDDPTVLNLGALASDVMLDVSMRIV